MTCLDSQNEEPRKKRGAHLYCTSRAGTKATKGGATAISSAGFSPLPVECLRDHHTSKKDSSLTLFFGGELVAQGRTAYHSISDSLSLESFYGSPPQLFFNDIASFETSSRSYLLKYGVPRHHTLPDVIDR